MPPERPVAPTRCACPATAGMAARRALDTLTLLLLAATWLLALSGSACSTARSPGQRPAEPWRTLMDPAAAGSSSERGRPGTAESPASGREASAVSNTANNPASTGTSNDTSSSSSSSSSSSNISNPTTTTTGNAESETAALPGKAREEARIRAVKASVLAALHMSEPPSPEVVARARASLSLEDVARAFRKYDQAVLAQLGTEGRIPRRNQSPTQSVHPLGRKAHHRRPTGPGFKRTKKHAGRHSRPVTLFFSSELDASLHRQPADVVEGKLRLYFSPVPTRTQAGHRRRPTARAGRARGQKKTTVTCSVYLLQTGNTTKGALAAPGETYLLDTKALPLASPGWQSFLVTPAVQAWLAQGSRELALLVDVEGRPAEELFYLEQGSPLLARLEPRVEVAYRPPAPAGPAAGFFSRDRRHAPGAGGGGSANGGGGGGEHICSDEDGVSTCCRYEQSISYVALGWETWILQPNSYQSYQCSGECPAEYRPATAYSRIKSLMHDIDPDDWSAPCCAPTLFTFTPYMYLNRTGGINVTIIRDAVVQECRCL